MRILHMNIIIYNNHHHNFKITAAIIFSKENGLCQKLELKN